MTSNPSPSQILAAFRDYGVDTHTYKGWDTVGRAWQGPSGSPGLTGAVVHHTANPNARPGNIANILHWCVNAYDKPVCNMLVGKAPGESYLLAAGSSYHCGDGGPVPRLGVPSRGFLGQTRFFGIEIDDAGTQVGTLSDYQVENVGRVLAALADLCGWDTDIAIGTHKCYTDGCHGWQSSAPPTTSQGGTRGRKNDTIDGPWASWPGSSTPEMYNAAWWRNQAKRWAKSAELWDGTVPNLGPVQRAAREGLRTVGTWRVACRLHDLGFFRVPAERGEQPYPVKAVARFQAAQGMRRPDGEFTERTQRRLFGVRKP